MVDSHARSDSVVASTTPGNIAKSLFVARTARILDLRERAEQAERERDEARADRKVLAEEVQMWRDHDHWEGVCDHDPPQCAVCRVVDATDASGALTRGGGE